MAEPNYSLPSWLQTNPTDTAKNFVSGLQIGATLGEARNRLQQSANQAAMEAQTKSDSIAANALKEQQELAVQKEYQQTQAALKSQEIAAAQQKIGLATMQAARQFQAQQQYQKDFSDLTASGMPEDQAARSAIFRNLGMFGTNAGSGAAALRVVSQRGAQEPKFMTDPVTGTRLAYNPVSGHYTALKAPTSVTDASSFQAQPLIDKSTGKAVPGKAIVPRPGGSWQVITTSTKNPNSEAIKALEQGKFGFWLTEGKDPKVVTPEYQAAKAQYQQLKAGGSIAPTAAPAATTQQAPLKVTGVRVGGVSQTAAAPVSAPAAEPSPAATPAAVEKAPEIPGLSSQRPKAASEQTAGDKYSLGATEGDKAMKALKSQIAGQQKAASYDQIFQQAGQLYTAMKRYQDDPKVREKVSYTDEAWNNQRKQLATLMSQLDEEDQQTITGE